LRDRLLVAAAGLRHARADAAVGRGVTSRRQRAEDRQLLVNLLAGAFGTADLFPGDKTMVSK